MLQLLCGDSDRPDNIHGVMILDPLIRPAEGRHELVLGVGLRDPDEIAALLDDLSDERAGGLIVRMPVDLTDAVTTAVERSQVPLLGLAPATSWMQLAAVLRSVLTPDEFEAADQEMLGGVPSGDLFALANADRRPA